MPIVNGAYDAPTWNNNAPPAIDASELQDMCDTIETYGTQKADVDYVNTFVRPNLLDNWYFVGGGSQQGGGQFPINQRRSTAYSTGAYTIDRWYNRQNLSVSLVSGGLKIQLSSTGGYPFFSQRLENGNYFLGKTLTVSVMISEVSPNFKGVRLDVDLSNSVSTNSSNYPSTATFCTAPGVYSATATLPSTSDYSGVNCSLYFGANNRAVGDYCVISAIKLELGSTQTLAHQENGVWMLNEHPNYQQELARCQRFYYNAIQIHTGGYWKCGLAIATSTSALTMVLPLPVSMRTAPTLTYKGEWRICGGNSYSFYDVTNIALAQASEQSGGNLAAINLTATGAILTTGQPYMLQVSADTTADICLSADL